MAVQGRRHKRTGGDQSAYCFAARRYSILYFVLIPAFKL
jgi:hypothetical protein